MSVAACIAQLRAAGTIDAERARRLEGEYKRLRAGYAKLGAAADEAASRDFVGRLDSEHRQARRQAALQIATQRRILKGLLDHVKAGRKGAQYAVALFDHHEAVPGVSNISNGAFALRSLAWSRMGDFLGHFKRDLAGRIPHPEDLADMLRALHGEKTGNATADELAAAFKDTGEWLRRQFNIAGGHIRRMESWALPQAHDSFLIAKAGYEKWRDFIRPLLAGERMIDQVTNRPFTDETLEEALQSVWRSIASDGLDKMEPGQMVGSKVANQRADHRFLVFRDADSWTAYQRRFGRGDAFNAIVSHIDGMTKDISAMRVLGPNPGLTVRWLGDMLRKGAAPTMDGATSRPLGKAATKAARETDRMWRYYRGELTAPDPANRNVARFFSGIRNWNVASNLGGAMLSAVTTDPVFASMTAKFNDLPATRLMGDYLAQMNPASAAAREEALHAGLVFNEMTTTAEQLWREDTAMRLNVHEVTSRLASATQRLTLLEPHTAAMKKATGLGFMRDMAAHAGQRFDQLSEAARRRYERYGIDAGTWDTIRSTPVYEQDGAGRLLRPGDVASRELGFTGPHFDAAMKLFEMIDSETKFATPGELLRAQTMLAFGGKGTAFERGTIAGEMLHSATQFKTYSVIAIMTHMQRALYGRGGMSQSSYALTLPLFLTMGGVMTIALKDLANGKNPEPMDSPQLWARGFVQGGGSGILGDFIASGVQSGSSRTGGGLMGYLAGPTMSNIVDPLDDLVLGSIGKAADGSERTRTTLGRDAWMIAQRNIPGSNIWYLNLAAKRMMLDQLSEAVDPNYRRSWARMEKRARDQRTAYWWRPGEETPESGPDWSNALGGEE